MSIPPPTSDGQPLRELPDPVPDHPLLRGLRELGRGESSIVLDGGDGQRVFKVLSSPADYFYLTADDRPRGPHFPRVFRDHGPIGAASNGYTFRLVELEHLHPISGPAQQVARTLADAYWAACEHWANMGAERGRLALYHLTQSPPASLPPGILQAIAALSDFIEDYPVQPDLLNPRNLMMRDDGTLVFSDPVFLA